MTSAKEKLFRRLLEGSSDLIVEIVVADLEHTLQTIITETERLLKNKELEDWQVQDLTDLYLDGRAIVRVLYYYTGEEYLPETVAINKAFDKQREWI